MGVTVLLAAIFLISGVIKLIPMQAAVESFARWGYPDWFRIAVGVAEVTGAILLLIPQLAWIGGAGLSIMMVGAGVTHLGTTGEAIRAIVPLALFVLLAWVTLSNLPRRSALPLHEAQSGPGMTKQARV
jgi:uncharacterized membrane protein YphA (DoxX/SURF4 family)